MTEAFDQMFQMRVSGAFLEKIDAWRAQNRSGSSGIPSRAEAIRRLVGHGLDSQDEIATGPAAEFHHG